MDLGSAGSSDTLVRVYCNLQPVGFRVVRRGWKKGLPLPSNNEESCYWIFCPLKKFPRDRVLVEECKKCSHFKRVSHTLKRMRKQQSEQESPPLDLTIIKHKKKPKNQSVPLKEFSQAIEEKESQDREWEQEEKKIFGDNK